MPRTTDRKQPFSSWPLHALQTDIDQGVMSMGSAIEYFDLTADIYEA
jgi:hypothetical protein